MVIDTRCWLYHTFTFFAFVEACFEIQKEKIGINLLAIRYCLGSFSVLL